MKLLSIDIETTGLRPEAGHQILEIGCVLFDPQPTIVKEGHVDSPGTRWQTFECLIRPPTIIGDPFALQMNQEILQELAGVKPTHIPIYDDVNLVVPAIRKWLHKHGVGQEKIHACGKNYGMFDSRFLEYLPGWDQMPLSHRVLDPGSLCFEPSDGEILKLDTLLEKAGKAGLVTHRALDDALAVATLVTAVFPAKLQ